MQVEELWRNVRRSENCRIFHREGFDPRSDKEGGRGNEIFSLGKKLSQFLIFSFLIFFLFF